MYKHLKKKNILKEIEFNDEQSAILENIRQKQWDKNERVIYTFSNTILRIEVIFCDNIKKEIVKTQISFADINKQVCNKEIFIYGSFVILG